MDFLVKNLSDDDIVIYFRMLNVFKIIWFFCNENKLNKNDFDFEPTSLYRAIENFVSTFVLIDFNDTNLISKEICDYYNLSSEEDLTDYIINFKNGIFNIYNYLYYNPKSNSTVLVKFESIKEKIIDNISNIIFFDKISEYKENIKIFKKSMQDNLIDKFLSCDKENPKIFLFLVEVFSNKGFGRTDILNYITFFDLILTHKPNSNRFNIEDSISQQFIQKISSCICLTNDIKNEQQLNLLKTELKLIYNYRSDILHGNFNKTNEDLDKFLNIPYYREPIATGSYKYLRKYTAIELCILDRLNYFFKIVFKLAAEKPLFIKALK